MSILPSKKIIGLSSEEAALRMQQGRNNKPVESASKTVKQIIFSNVFTYFNLIFFVIAIALICVGEFKHLTFLGAVIVNTIIGIVQECNSKRTLDKLSLINAPCATVLRDSAAVRVPVEGLVIDDVIILGAGDQIPADAVVLSGSCSVNESLITGESDEISKKEKDNLLSGSFVVSGKCFAKLTAVGEDSFASKLTLDAKRMKKRKSAGMMRSLTMLIKFIGIVLIPLAVGMIYREITLYNNPANEAVVNTSAALIGMIPEGLYLLTSVALAVSVMRLAKQKTLVHELGCIEALARVDTLCVDKTGTITEPGMHVDGIVCIDDVYDDEFINENLAELIGNLEPDNDTMRALWEYYQPDDVAPAKKVVPFSSSIKYSGAELSRKDAFVIGAPEFILTDRYYEIKATVDEYAATGARVLLFAAYSDSLKGGTLDSKQVTPIALILLCNHVRENARETFGFFLENGVAVKVISGDDPATAAGAARDAGIEGAENYVNAGTLKTDKDIYDAAQKYTVFGRVTPEQKRKLVIALKSQGHTVAMTGDGVNDVLALKEADCSIAMASGSEVASQVSDLVLLNSDFAAMPSVVAEGRRVINNIERSASLFLVKNIFSFFLAIISVFAAFEYPISPANLTLINTMTIGIPSFFLALEPNHSKVKGKFLRNVLYRAAPAGALDLFMLIFIVMFKDAFNLPSTEVSTMCTLILGVVGMIMLWYVSKPFDKPVNAFHIVLFFMMGVLMILGLVYLPFIFDVSSLSYGAILILVLLVMLSVPLMISLRWIMSKMAHGLNRITLKMKKQNN